MLWLELGLLLLMLVLGARRGGLFLGMVGGVGMAVLVFGLHLTPANPPISVMLIIATVILAASTMQAAGGIEYMVSLAETVLRNHPQHITFIAPLVVYVVCFFSGTGYASVSLIPVIAEVARETGIRPERPLSISVIASQQAGYSSPICAAMAVMIGLFGPRGISLTHILLVCVPASILGILAGSLYASRMGKDLDKDPEYLDRLAKGEVSPLPTKEQSEKGFTKEAKLSVVLFMSAAIIVILFGAFPSLRPILNYAGKPQPLPMPDSIEIVMLAVATLIVLTCKVAVGKITDTSVFKAGMMGVIIVFGVAWMSDTVVSANTNLLKSVVQTTVAAHPWMFIAAVCAVDVLLASQAVTSAAMMPLGLMLGIPVATLIGMFPAVTVHFFLPVNTVQVASVALDSTKTTKIGKYVLNHSFMMPGLVTLTVVLAVSMLLAKWVIG
jgi:anaerobic C4-dicarboxylate transporter-like protein